MGGRRQESVRRTDSPGVLAKRDRMPFWGIKTEMTEMQDMYFMSAERVAYFRHSTGSRDYMLSAQVRRLKTAYD